MDSSIDAHAANDAALETTRPRRNTLKKLYNMEAEK